MSIEQYKYYYTNAGYKSSKGDLCVDTINNIEVNILSQNMHEGEYCFTYVPVNTNDLYMLQKAVVNTYDLVHGIHFSATDLQQQYAVSFIGRLDMSHAVSASADGKLQPWRFPRPKNLSLQELANLDVNVILECIHVLLSTDSRIALLGDSKEQKLIMEQYISMILYLLPAHYANRIGFTVYPNGFGPGIINAEDAELNSIRLFATSTKVSESSFRVIRISANGHGNVTLTDDDRLHPYVLALKNRIRNLSLLENFKSNPEVIKCFGDDGRIDVPKLEMIIRCQDWIGGNRTLENAKELLDIRARGKDFGLVSNSVVRDIIRMLDREEFNDEILSMLNQARSLSSMAEMEVAPILVSKAFDKMSNNRSPLKQVLSKDLTDEAAKHVVRYVENHPNPWKMFEANEALKDDCELTKVFNRSHIRNFSVLNMLFRAYERYPSNAILLMVSEYMKIEKTHNYKEFCQGPFDTELLKYAYEQSSNGIDFLAAVMASCYRDNVTVDKGGNRVERLAYLIRDNFKNDPYKGVEFLINLNEKVETILYIKRNGRDYSESNQGENPKTNIIPLGFLKEEFLDKLSFSQVLCFVDKASQKLECGENSECGEKKKCGGKLEHYETLYHELLERVCNLEEAKKHVTLENNYGLFHSLFDEGKEDHQTTRKHIIDLKGISVYQQLADYAKYLEDSEKVYDKIWEYRSGFTKRCWNCLFDSHKREVWDSWSKEIKTNQDDKKKKKKKKLDLELVNQALLDRKNADENRRRLIEIIIDLYNSDNRNQIKGNKDYTVQKFRWGNLFRSLLWGILAFVLLNLTPMISATLLDYDMMAKIIDNTVVSYPHHIVMILWVMLVYMISVIRAYRRNSQHRGNAKKAANSACLRIGILPVFFYCVGFAIQYFLM